MIDFIPKLTTEDKAILDTNIVEGQFIITKDSKKLYMDIDNKTRILLNEQSGETSNLKYTTLIGDNSTTTFTINHNLNTEDICVNGIDVVSKSNVWLEYAIIDNNSISIAFNVAPTTNSLKIIIVG